MNNILFLSTKFKNVTIITLSNSAKTKLNNKVKIVCPEINLIKYFGRRTKFLISLIYLFKEIINNKNCTVLCFQGIMYCILLCKLLRTKIIIRSNSSPSGWSKNFIKNIFYKKIYGFADNIIVMDQGEIVQVGLPKDLFEKPKTTFVGYFIGSPAMNLFSSEVFSNNSIKFNNLEINTRTDLSKIKNKKVKLGIRSEFIKIANEQKDNVVNVKVSRVEDFGNFKLITGKIGDFEIKSKVERETPISSENLKLYLPADKCCIYSEDKLVQ